ncbi:XRE family transcriptional regulator [Qipengyuania flava]|uniref:XRE family transcriptional regulator n=1 Tax=Qipengyuania flava TaxID=192812 RepID=UPI003219CC4D
MNAEASPRLPFNPEVLRWAREYAQLSVHEAAKKASTSPENVEAWEDGEAVPTVRQGRLLAKAYDRGFLEFFRTSLPPVAKTELVPDFRLHRHVPKPEEDRELKKVQRWAESMRISALDLYEVLGESPPEFPQELFATLSSNPERVASQARQLMDFTLDKQVNLPSTEVGHLPKKIRGLIDQLGILVFRHPALDKFGSRGLCLFKQPLPIIIFSSEAPAAQCFTLAHEFAHIILQTSALSGPPSNEGHGAEAAVERWCNQFAGAFLVPADAVADRWAKPNEPLNAIGDETLKQWARSFGISKHAMLIRLVDLGYVEPQFYWGGKRAEFLKEEEDFQGGGRSKYYGVRFRSQNGELYTSLVMEAWDRGLITNHNAAEFMGIKNLAHLNDIREDFTSS